jgi:hypothetical protein|tara:strand:- start:398 stop:829 length:432 start_codon:yes stop_codon:yes gene_type:complete
MAFRKLVGSYKDYTLSTHVIEAGYLAVDVDTGSLRIGDGVTAGGTEVSGGGGSSSSLGDLSAVGSTLLAPSNADLTLSVAGTGNVVLTGLTFPNADGSANQVLITNGSGVLSFANNTATINLDGGTADSDYGGLTALDGGTAE